MRIRTIKPEFFTHPSTVKCSVPARLLLISLLGQADDEGRLYDAPRRIGGLAFGDDDPQDPAELLAELADKGRITRYEVDGKRCIQVENFLEHQAISKPTDSRIPPEPGKKPPVKRAHRKKEASGSTPGAVQEHSSREGNGTERKGTGKGESLALFERFYAPYPLKKDRGHALTAWHGAVRKADPEAIIAACERFAADPNLPTDRTKIPYAATWLKGERWLDTPLEAELTDSRRPEPMSAAAAIELNKDHSGNDWRLGVEEMEASK